MPSPVDLIRVVPAWGPGLAGALLCAIAAGARAESTQEPTQTLDQAANDPTASLMAVQLQNIYVGDYHNLSGESGNSVVLRPVVPFKTGSLNHIARATIPYATASPSGETGLGDSVLFDLIVFNPPGGAGASVP